MQLKIFSNGELFTAVYDDSLHEVISCHKWHIAKGYARSSFTQDGKRGSFSMHRLVLGFPEKSLHIHHINENRLDNRLENLIVLPRLEHVQKHPRTGVSVCLAGSKNGMAKLDEKTVLEIRRLYEGGEYSGRELAKMYGIGHTPMAYLLNRKTWKHI
jgi:hypothetical protein